MLGKTGTAEVKKHHKDEDERDLEKWNPNAAHAWFAGWAPAEDPEIAIVVLVEHGGAGGTRRVADRAADHRGLLHARSIRSARRSEDMRRP